MSYAPLPTDDERARILSELVDDEAEESRLQAELELRQAELAQRRHKIAQKRFYIAPIRRLPWEMLGEFFMWAQRSKGLSAIKLSHVCKSWRHAALMMPALWARPNIVVHPLGYGKDILRMHMERSGQCPLDVTIPSAGPIPDCQIKIYENTVCDIVRVIHTHQHRLRSFDLTVVDIVTADAAVKLCTGAAPLLESLSIAVDAHPDRLDEHVLSALQHAFFPCPRLTQLKLVHCIYNLRTSVNFSSVTSITLHHLAGINLAFLEDILPTSSCLARLHLVHWLPPSDGDDMEDDDTDISLDNLREFELEDTPGGINGIFALRHFCLPGLKSLSLHNLMDSDVTDDDEDGQEFVREEIADSIESFLTRSALPKLQTLELSDSEMSGDGLITILRLLDSLKTLSLRGMQVDSQVFQELGSKPKKSHPPILPRLSTLSLTGCSHLSAKAIGRLVAGRNARLKPVYPALKLLRVANCWGITKQDSRKWAKLDPKLTIEFTVVDLAQTMEGFFQQMLGPLYVLLLSRETLIDTEATSF